MISKIIDENKIKIIELFNNTSDLILHEFEALSENKVLVAYINGLIDKEGLDEHVIRPLIENLISPLDFNSTILISEVAEISTIKDVVDALTSGHVVVFIDGMEIMYELNLCKYEKRAIEQSSLEEVIRGPKEAFVEDIHVNKTLIRRKIRNRNLVFEDYEFGKQTNTKVSLVYVNGIVNPQILAELKVRLKKIKVDVVLDGHYIEEYIEDSPRTLIRTVNDTEKPDVLAGKILEGRIGILCDGSPNCLIVPKIFIECLMTSEDYYIKPKFSTYLRVIRLLSFLISTLLAGTYIALATFHQEMVPTTLLISIAGQREGVPLSPFLEAIVMILFFEFLKEAGLRLPKPMGATVTLVGGLVIGQAAVEADVVSAIMVIIVSASGITEFVVPPLRDLIVVYRLVILILGGTLGLFGVSCGIIIIAFQFISTKAFGVPYLFPIAPYDKEGMKDFIRRGPVKEFNYRPKYISDENNRKRN